MTDDQLNGEKEQPDEYVEGVLNRLTGATIVAFGGNERGEIFLSTLKDGEPSEFILSGEEDGSVSLSEVEK
jgi:hypothetical protein